MKNLYVLSFLCFFLVSKIFSQTVQIGNQIWMTSNLDVSTFRNGDLILEAKNSQEWKTACENQLPAFCYYNFDKKTGEVFGKIYNYYTISDYRGLSPIGFSIPTLDEWETLSKEVCNYDDYVRLNGRPNFSTDVQMNSDGAKKLLSEPKYGVKLKYVEHGGYYETKWVDCNNCSYWSEQQKRNNPCNVCRNKGGKYVKTGKFIPKTKEKIEEKIQISGGVGGNNQSGFSSLNGGCYGEDGFDGINRNDYYWTSSKEYFDYPDASPPRPSKWGIVNYYIISSNYLGEEFHCSGWDKEDNFELYGYYVRCLKD